MPECKRWTPQYPLLTWERPYRSEIYIELNIERYAFRRDGSVGFYQPMGTHDDVWWSLSYSYSESNLIL
jgi:hypothetical protein